MNALPAVDAASRPAEEVLRDLGTSAEVGLDGAEAGRRLDEDWANSVTKPASVRESRSSRCSDLLSSAERSAGLANPG